LGLATGSDYKVRIFKGTTEDYSDSNFSISPVPSITITSPTAASVWDTGTLYAITWTSTGAVGSSVKIELFKEGLLFDTLTASTANDGSFGWTPSHSLFIGSDYQIKVTDTSNASITDTSAEFTINNTQAALTITSPAASSTWYKGTQYDITWTSAGPLGSPVKLELLKGGSFVSTIGTTIYNGPSGGSYPWTPGGSLTVGSDYQVRIIHQQFPSVTDNSPYFTIADASTVREDLVGTWSSGVWYRNSNTGGWVNMTTPAVPIAAGDIDGDSIADLIGVWSSGLWVKFSATGSWTRISSPPLPTHISCGDMNGDGRDDIVGSWPSGTFFRDTLGASWTYVSSPAGAVAAGDLDGDGTDDIIGAWSNGLWVKYSTTSTWARLDKNPPLDIAAGDLDGDGRDDVLGTWPSGTFFRDTIGGSWVYVSTQADAVAAGDLDGDGTDDLIGTWSGAYVGLWVKYSATLSWKKITLSVPTDLDAGLFRGGAWDEKAERYSSISEPLGGSSTEGPGLLTEYNDLSDSGPGGWSFICQEEANLVPQVNEMEELERIPGPGEPGFLPIEQINLVPQERKPKKQEEN
jgi:hypothetical protein